MLAFKYCIYKPNKYELCFNVLNYLNNKIFLMFIRYIECIVKFIPVTLDENKIAKIVQMDVPT